MNTFEIIALGIALALNSLSVHIAGGNILAKESPGTKITFIFVFSVVPFIMIGAGIWVGYWLQVLMVKSGIYIAVSILFIFGIKMLFSHINEGLLSSFPDFRSFGISIRIALVEGVTPLCIGLAVGIVTLEPVYQLITIGKVLFTGVFLGVILGTRLSRHTLHLRFSSVGALFVLGIAIKMIINLFSV